MYSCFPEYLLEKAPFTEAELTKIDAVTYKRMVKKGEILFEEGTQWRYNGFLCSGLIYTYNLDQENSEKILGISTEKYWLGDRRSLLTGQPMPFSARAYEESYITYIDQTDFEKLRITIPRFNEMMNNLIEKRLISVQKRISDSMILSDEERYAALIKNRPNLLLRVSPNMIANYLNIEQKSFEHITKGIPLKND